MKARLLGEKRKSFGSGLMKTGQIQVIPTGNHKSLTGESVAPTKLSFSSVKELLRRTVHIFGKPEELFLVTV